MKIVCPECQAAYEIDVPESPAKNLSAKCAVCNSKFTIKKEPLVKSSHSQSSMAGPPLAQIDSGLAPDSTDDFLSGLQEDRKDLQDLNQNQEESTAEDDKNLDDYLDQLLQEGFAESGNDILEESTLEPPTDSDPTDSAMPSEDDLDRLFDSLIADEIQPAVPEGDTADLGPSPETDQEEKNLDALLDEIILDNLDEQVETEPQSDLDPAGATLPDSDPPITEKEEVDESVADPIDDFPEMIETPEPKNLSPENNVEESAGQEDSLADASAEENSLNKEGQQEEIKETFEDLQETADPEPAAEQQEEEKSDDDLWAEAFADQEALSDTDQAGDAEIKSAEATEVTDSEPPAEQQEEEKSDDDLWAEAFADQEALSDTDQAGDAEIKSAEATEVTDSEPSTEQQEEEKSDDDLWAEAFADQEALSDTDVAGDTEIESAEATEVTDSEPPAEQQEEEKSDDDLWAEAFADQEALSDTDEAGDAEIESDETNEAEVSNDEENTEETVVAEGALNSEDEAPAPEEEEEPDSGEEPEANEFGISEADYEEDDDEVGDQYDDEYGEDEEDPFSPKKKKFGFFSLPSTRTGKLVLGGGVLAVMLTGGGAYFALQTLAPPNSPKCKKNPWRRPPKLSNQKNPWKTPHCKTKRKTRRHPMKSSTPGSVPLLETVNPPRPQMMRRNPIPPQRLQALLAPLKVWKPRSPPALMRWNWELSCRWRTPSTISGF